MVMKLGLQLWSQNTTWESLKEHALLADDLGYDLLSTGDHLVPAAGGDTSLAQFECWQVLSAWGALTKHVRIGALVTANSYRHPVLLAKQAATLDHVTSGRAFLGIGAGWMEYEHRAYGIPFGTARERLDRLSESVRLIRSLFDSPRTTFAGTHYTITDAPAEPKPVQARLPIMVGGGGERRTLRVAARYADYWHAAGPSDQIARKVEILRAYCAELGRRDGGPVPFGSSPVLITDDASAVEARWHEISAANGMDASHQVPSSRLIAFSGNPDQVASYVFKYWQAGARGYILHVPSPHEAVTIERFATEIRPRVDALIARSLGPSAESSAEVAT